MRPHRLLTVLLVPLLATGCTKKIPFPDLGERYSVAAKYHGPDRNAVIVVPGILGSRLVDSTDDSLVWGAFSGNAANPKRPAVARRVSLPMGEGVPLAELTDDLRTDGALDRLRLRLLFLPIQLDAYVQILATLGVGGYRDKTLAEAGAVDYGTDHYTCFQFDYDWRRDNVESAQKLYQTLLYHRKVVQTKHAERFGGKPEDYRVKFDVVAHSMGGLVLRYMLRFGDAPLPADGSLPPVTWAGAEMVDRAILVGTPNAGSPSAFIQLLKGVKFSPFQGRYPPAILGTMPSIYQIMPRDRHGNIAITPPTDNLYDPEVWAKFGWGLADPDRDADLKVLLPGVEDKDARLRIATEHVRKCLLQAKWFQAALDQPAKKPDGLTLVLYAGDGLPTRDHVEVNAWGDIEKVGSSTGDGTVPRSSALLDERVGQPWRPFIETPINWDDVNFLPSEHLGLTSNGIFADNLLLLLLDTNNASGRKPKADGDGASPGRRKSDDGGAEAEPEARDTTAP